MPAIRPTGWRSSQCTAVAVIADKVRSYMGYRAGPPSPPPSP